MKVIVLALTLTSALVFASAAVLKNDERDHVLSPHVLINRPRLDEFEYNDIISGGREKRHSPSKLSDTTSDASFTPTDFTQEPVKMEGLRLLRKGEYVCGNKICNLKVGDQPCGDGICQYPIDRSVSK